MHILYNLLIHITAFGLGVAARFNKKMRLFVEGRKNVFDNLQEKISPTDKTVWFHFASLGEFEQGVPIMEEVRKLKPDHRFIISFFSPSGFEIKKNTPLADVVVYLPLDTPSNAKRFVEAVNPNLVFFVKYEFWPNYLFELQKKNVPTYLVSGVFRRDQLFFKSAGAFMRRALQAFDHFFVQNEESKLLLESIGFSNMTVSGDTRFDRVAHQIEMDNTLPFADEFKGDSLCIVCGSTWPEDVAVLLEYVNSAAENVKFIIAPHKIEPFGIEELKAQIVGPTLLHSQMKGKDAAGYQVLIIDCIGLLSKLYSYADIAYVGGAMGKTGLHNILEPATFGIPIIIGKNFKNFPEAEQLQRLQGLFAVTNSRETTAILYKLVNDPDFRNRSGRIARDFVNNNSGATQLIMDHLAPV